jgi:hypothetical protein
MASVNQVAAQKVGVTAENDGTGLPDLSVEEGKLRAQMLSELDVLKLSLNKVFEKYAKQGIHPASVTVYEPGETFHGKIVVESFYIDVDVFKSHPAQE